MVLGEASEILVLCWLPIKRGRLGKGNREDWGRSEAGKYLLGPMVDFSM